MLKIGSKRRRTRQEILDERALKEQRELEIDMKLAEHASLKANLASVGQPDFEPDPLIPCCPQSHG